MKRKDFLQGISLAGVGAMIPGTANNTRRSLRVLTGTECVLIPSETAGPFPLDLTDNQFYFRQDVREDRAGVQLNLRMKIIGLENCLPMPNVRVNIWHCDKDGNYSGYGTETGKTYLRGYQLADAEGGVEFITIFPGWYPGRICHIHFQVYVSSVYAAVSQLTFPLDTRNEIYADNPSIYTIGPDPLSYNQDGVFANGYVLQLATLTPNTDTGGYDSYLEVAIQGSGLTGLATLEPETGGLFKLRQNFPNPFVEETTIPFNLTEHADVQLELWNLAGKKVGVIERKALPAGEHDIKVNLKALGLPASSYVYQLQVSNSKGTYRQCKMMTIQK